MWRILVCIFAQILVAFAASNKAGAVREYEVIKLEKCKYKNDLKTTFEVEIKKNGDEKYIAGKLGFPIDFDNTFKLFIRADRWTGSEWKIDYYKQDGLCCEMLQKLVPDIFGTFVSNMRPVVPPTKCNIIKNSYTFDKVAATSNQVNIPSLMYSKYRLEAKITTKDNVEVLCVSGEVVAKE